MTDQTVALSPRSRSVGRSEGPTTRLRSLDQRISTAAFWVLLAAGFALRVVLLFTNSYKIDSDNAVVYLVAKHISEGDITWFFWGQTYGGTLLEFVAGGAMMVFGPHVEVLSIVGALFFAVATVLIRQIATRAFSRPVVGNVAGILFWFSGYWMQRVGTSEPGFYGPSLVLGLLTIWLVLRGERAKSYLQWVFIGLAAGLALWQSPMGIAIAAPAVLVAVIRQLTPFNTGVLVRYLVGAAAFVLGALPWLIVFASNASAVKPQRDVPVTVANFTVFFSRMLPGAFSVSEPMARYLVAITAVALLLLLVVLTVVKRSLWLGTVVVSSAAVVAVTVLGTGTLLEADSLRYAIFILPALAIGLAFIVTLIPFTGLVAMALAVTFTITQTYQLYPDLRVGRDSTFIVGNISALSDYLEEKNIDAVYADYWISYSLTAETNEEVKAATISGPRRYTPYEADAAAAPVATVIVLLDRENDRALQAGTSLPAFTRAVVADYAVYTFAQPFDAYDYPWQLY